MRFLRLSASFEEKYASLDVILVLSSWLVDLGWAQLVHDQKLHE
ncbi:hypothetical protein FRUB_09010 [Fimbriiglobus ruber]|uniref:Uncharacterized protein n=1 Tax=Fimbriiglobus ruber TaxID=1908690 RepID=A0A225DJX2_9BACT|nr:hypothetical protein FRUB_09010 [Fimbriiglobus ruber]